MPGWRRHAFGLLKGPLQHPAISLPARWSVHPVYRTTLPDVWKLGPEMTGESRGAGGSRRGAFPLLFQYFFSAPADSGDGKSNSSPVGCRDELCSSK